MTAEKVKRARGRPNVLRKAYRLNLYVEADFAADLKRLARYLKAKHGRPFSISQAISIVTQRSLEFRAMKAQRPAGRGGQDVSS
jgi:hypothetical protein